MPTLTDQPCLPWDIDLSRCKAMQESSDSDLVAMATEWASTFLWRRSGRKVGVCTKTVRVVSPGCACSPCICGPRALITLTSSLPVVAITSVRDVGANVVLDPGRYEIVGTNQVGLVGGVACGWTTAYCGEMEFVFTAGWEPDAEALNACSVLACQWYYENSGAECTPVLTRAQMTSMRRGRNGRRDVTLTGIQLVDHWLLSHPIGSAGMGDPAEATSYTVG